MNKKAALELSINAIVIIIIAIVMLALGLGFVRMLFGGATSRFGALIEQEPEPPIPTSADLMTLSRGMVITAPKKSEVVKVSVYNPTNADLEQVSPSIDCSMDTVAGNFKANTKTIRQGEYETFDILFTINDSPVQPSAHLCEIELKNKTVVTTGTGYDYSKDFTISIK